ncbi:MAG: hypothetical protein ACI87O_002725 [Planctomycetota bacterium]|jgi:hypothetical protein
MFKIHGFQNTGELKVQVKGVPPHFAVPQGTKKLAARKMRREAKVVAHFADVLMGAQGLKLVLGGETTGLAGSVTDDQGTPIDDFRIAVYSAAKNTPKTKQRFRLNAQTPNESPALSERFKKTAGQFSLSALSAGEWGLLVTAKNHPDVWISPVRTGETALNIVLNRHASLSGSVVDPAGLAVYEGRVRIAHLESEEYFDSHLRPHDKGIFDTSGITAGLCTVQFGGIEGGPMAPPFELILSPGEQRTKLVIICQQPGSIHGSIDLEWQQPPATVTAQGPITKSVQLDGQGLFRITDLPAGSYEVKIKATPESQPDYQPGWSEYAEITSGQDLEVNLGPFDQGTRFTGQLNTEGHELGKTTVRFVSTSGSHAVFETPVDPLGQFSIILPTETEFAVLLTATARWYRTPWFVLDLSFVPRPDDSITLSLPTARFKLQCVDGDGKQVQWKEDSHVSDIRFLPLSIPNPSEYIAGRIQEGKILPTIFPGCSYTVEGFVQDLSGKAWRVKKGQTFTAPDNRESTDITIVLHRER